ncbi:MAG: 3-dehydroquinate synthase [Planctomycetota bacterium]|jgi:3-dehydroquinate synthase
MTQKSQARLSVPFTYPVVFTEDLFSTDNPVLADLLNGAGTELRVHAFLDSGLSEAQPGLKDRIVAYGAARLPGFDEGAVSVYPGGEAAKDGLAVVEPMIREITDRRLCRHSFLLAIGGGAFLDAAGFAAALVHRGVRLIRVPSTALSQDDSGVGTKNGVNFAGQKNMLGCFAPPFAVINDLALLRTLSPAQIGDGFAEAFKVAMIKDGEFFDFLCDHAAELRSADSPHLAHMITRSAELHLNHIMGSGDPFEAGDARPLDFGHWAAHWLEVKTGHALTHGAAVGIGLALDSCYAARQGSLSEVDLDRALAALEAAGLLTWHSALKARTAGGALEALEGLEQFREHLGGQLAITLPRGIGSRYEVDSLDPLFIEASLGQLEARATGAGGTV